MKYKKSPLDYFLQQRISDNAKELKNTLSETLQMEQNCLEQIHLSINHCKIILLSVKSKLKNVVWRLCLSMKLRNLHSKTI